MSDILSRLAPDQSGALWIGLLVAFVVFGDFERLWSRRNLALLALLSVAPFLYDILDVSAVAQAWSFRGIVVVTGGMALWGIALAMGYTPSGRWTPNLPVPALRVLTALLLVAATAAIFTRPPDDAGTYTNLGAQRWTETGELPYSDEKLKGPDAPAFGAAATYGPLLYVAHLPFQLVLGPPGNPPEADPMLPEYEWPPTLATQLSTWTLFVVGLWAFFLIGRRYAGREVAWGMVAVLAGLPYFVGLGGQEQVIGGLRFASHIAPMTVVLLAFLHLDRPLLAGALLAAGAGVLFYPAFFFPVWFAWYAFRGDGLKEFTGGFAASAAAIALLVVVFTEPEPGQSAIRLFLESTLEHQEGTGPLEYGGSTFSFWNHHPSLAAILQVPLFGDTSLFKLSFMLFAAFCAVATIASKGRSPAQLAALTAAVAAAVQLWKTHATGSYVEWYLPLLMVALFAQGDAETVDADRSDGGPADAPSAGAGPDALGASRRGASDAATPA